jgi:2-polyprenyl-3-methyl-5-hydroxy-6-metoxy-1,4-benzoquinol methylase
VIDRVGASPAAIPAMPRRRPCPRCGSPQSRVALTARDNMLDIDGPFYLSECDRCGLPFQNPCATEETIRHHYPDSYGPYSSAEPSVTRSIYWHLRHRKGYRHLPDHGPVDPLRRWWGRWSSCTELYPDYVESGSVLEVGCASGAKLSLLKSLGWGECTGIEYSEYAAGLARERGFTVHAGRVEDTLDEVPPGSQDVVIASFVLEHLENPFEITERIATKLRPSGQYLIATLDVGSPDFALFGPYWYDLDLPRHLTFFRRRDLIDMLERSFTIQEVRYRPSVSDYVGSARYRSKRDPRRIDGLITAAGARLRPACVALAALGKASRICIQARKR